MIIQFAIDETKPATTGAPGSFQHGMRMRSKQLLNSLKGVTIPRLTHNAIALQLREQKGGCLTMRQAADISYRLH